MRIHGKHLLRTLAVVGAFVFVSMASAEVPSRNTSGVLTDSAGMTLYVFDKDKPNSGESMCVGPCAENWPPLPASDDDSVKGDFGIIKRYDGSRQWTYRGMPLYRWKNDVRPGDMNGDGVNNVWHVAK